jgi:hypothetical protein
MKGRPFIALWYEDRPGGDTLLHLLTKEARVTLPCPVLGANIQAIEEFLPDLVKALPSTAPPTRWLLLLEPSLPNAWLHLPWETLTLQGQPLSTQALVVRSAEWAPQGRRPKSAFFLNLFPSEEFLFGDHLQPLINSGSLRTCRPDFLQKQMTAVGDLIILAHGLAHGLVDAGNDPFDLPVTYPMPERIWLLACNVDNAMHILAQRLLKQGCRTVIVATADLSAPEIARLVEDLFSHKTGLEPGVSWLTQAEVVLNGAGSPYALTIWGTVDIDCSSSSQWNRLTWDEQHGARHTLPLDDETTAVEFHDAHQQAMSSSIWPLTRQWMLPSLLWLAEKHHHPAMAKLSEELGDSHSPEAIRGLAAVARRVGNYPQTARYLSQGLNLPDLSEKEKADYLGALTNLFIDLNLPESAAAAIELHEACLIEGVKDRHTADFKRLDWRARTGARCGKLHVALDHMTAKRKKRESDGGRELAWQLYLATWGQCDRQVPTHFANTFASEVTARLTANPQKIGHGNETIAYLLRSLAAHACLSDDPTARAVVSAWQSTAEDRLSDDDPGPWAYTMAYLYLQKAVPEQSFDRALSALERARYYLEAASFAGFAQRKDTCDRLRTRFQQRREATVQQLNENMGAGITRNQVLAEAASRTRTENETGHLRANAAKFGTLPL